MKRETATYEVSSMLGVDNYKTEEAAIAAAKALPDDAAASVWMFVKSGRHKSRTRLWPTKEGFARTS